MTVLNFRAYGESLSTEHIKELDRKLVEAMDEVGEFVRVIFALPEEHIDKENMIRFGFEKERNSRMDGDKIVGIAESIDGIKRAGLTVSGKFVTGNSFGPIE